MRGATTSAVTLRRRQIILQRRIVESQRCSSTPTHVHLQPNYYRPRRRRARRQILSSLISLNGTNLRRIAESNIHGKFVAPNTKILSLSTPTPIGNQTDKHPSSHLTDSNHREPGFELSYN